MDETVVPPTPEPLPTAVPVVAPVVPTPEPVVAAPVVVEAPVVYKAMVDLQYGDRFVKAGESTNDVPANSVKWLLEQKLIVREVT
jgi:hypothetical protein